jgi:hypothetical protein
LAATWAGISDISDTNYPIYRASDYYTHKDTAAVASNSSFYGLVYDLGAGLAGPVDSVIIYPKNFDSAHGLGPTGYVDVRVTVSESDPSFTGSGGSGGQVIANFRTNNNYPLVELSLTNASQYHSRYEVSGFRYVLIEFITVLGATSPLSYGYPVFLEPPGVSEIFLGVRGQLSRNPEMPWAKYTFDAMFNDLSSASGVTNRYSANTGGRIWQNTFSPEGSLTTPTRSDRFGLNDTVTLKGLWDDTQYGTRPFFWITDPQETQGDIIVVPDAPPIVHPDRRAYHQNVYSVVLSDSEFSLSLSGPFERDVTANFSEVPPYLSTILGYVPTL